MEPAIEQDDSAYEAFIAALMILLQGDLNAMQQPEAHKNLSSACFPDRYRFFTGGASEMMHVSAVRHSPDGKTILSCLLCAAYI